MLDHDPKINLDYLTVRLETTVTLSGPHKTRARPWVATAFDEGEAVAEVGLVALQENWGLLEFEEAVRGLFGDHALHTSMDLAHSIPYGEAAIAVSYASTTAPYRRCAATGSALLSLALVQGVSCLGGQGAYLHKDTSPQGMLDLCRVHDQGDTAAAALYLCQSEQSVREDAQAALRRGRKHLRLVTA